MLLVIDITKLNRSTTAAGSLKQEESLLSIMFYPYKNEFMPLVVKTEEITCRVRTCSTSFSFITK